MLLLFFYVCATAALVRLSFATPAILYTPSSPLHVISFALLSFVCLFSVAVVFLLHFTNLLHWENNGFTLTQILSLHEPPSSILFDNKVSMACRFKKILNHSLIQLSCVFFLFLSLQMVIYNPTQNQDLLSASYSMIYVRSIDVLIAAFNIGDYVDPLRGKVLEQGLLSSVWLAFIHMLLGFNMKNLILIRCFESLLCFCMIKKFARYFTAAHSFGIALLVCLAYMLAAAFAAPYFSHVSLLALLCLFFSALLFFANRREELMIDFYGISLSFAFLYLSDLNAVHALLLFALHTFFYFFRGQIKNKMLFLVSLVFFLPFLYRYDSFFAQKLASGGISSESFSLLSGLFFQLKFFPIPVVLAILLWQIYAVKDAKNEAFRAIFISLFFPLSLAWLSASFRACYAPPGFLSDLFAASFLALLFLLLFRIKDLPIFKTTWTRPLLCLLILGVLSSAFFAPKQADPFDDIIDQHLKNLSPKSTLIITESSPYFISKGYSAVPFTLAPYFVKKIDYRIRHKMLENVFVLTHGVAENPFPDYFELETVAKIEVSSNDFYILQRHQIK